MRTHFRRKLLRIAKYVAIGLVLLYAADWAAFAIRLVWGGGMGSVTVESFLKTPLKGEKTEYDYLGTTDVSCSQTLFPQYAAPEWNSPCWWLARHKARWQ
jgi:hypothetical protein